MIFKKINFLLLLIFSASVLFGHLPPDFKKKKVNNLISLRNDCAPARKAVDMDVNNVRARLRIGGDLWWDGQGQGRYVVPKPAPGFPEVSAIFAGGVWLGGLDPAGNLKAAITQYPRGNVTDFWPGPLDENGETKSSVCSQWDIFFEIDGDNVRKHIAAWDASDGDLQCDEIPDDVKYWPGRGNPYWSEKYDFDLPDQNLGAFWDQPGGKAGVYDPCEGDFPLINIRDCEPITRVQAKELVPDEMVFWVYNDAGNNHLQTGADKIQMEIQVQAFAYATNDEVNDMTFLRYRLINKSIEDIQDCYFAMWVDPDLGCHLDDYIGCDVDRSLAYVYNEDALDGSVGDACPGGVNTYGKNIPIIGIDYFRGPRGPKIFKRDDDGNPILKDGKPILEDPEPGTGEVDTLVELGMTSFAYTNSGANSEPPGTRDPSNGTQAYNVLRGLWPDGRPITFGGQIVGNSGYNGPENQDTVKYVFPGLPNDDTQWSMCSAELPFGDRRTIQATGPILLQAGGLPEELIVGVVYVPDLDYPCPDITRLQFADDIAQSLFDNCFDITDGPDAPDMYGVELDRQLILLLANDSLRTNSNNAKQEYEEVDLQAPASAGDDNKYKFEGYKIYQLKNPAVTVQELDDPSKAKLIRQVDIKNGVNKIYNWYPKANPVEPSKLEYNSNLEVNGADQGIQNSFNILKDAFDDGGGRLVNHKDYYFLVVAYAYNNYKPWDNKDQVGQKRPYLEGRGNIRTYTYTPRPVVYKDLNSAYGQESEVTRIHGVGTGTFPLDLVEGTHEKILNGETDGRIVYKAGNAPFSVKVVDPLNIKNAEYSLEVIGDYDEKKKKFVEGTAKWKLTNKTTGNVLYSETTIDNANEQIAYGEGFSISMIQPAEPGNGLDDNGAIDQSFAYLNSEGSQWWNGGTASGGFPLVLPDGSSRSVAQYFQDDPEDPDGALTSFGSGFFTPIQFTRWRVDNNAINFLSPNWVGSYGFAGNEGFKYTNIEQLNNVDVVLTSDKSKWSRCVVVEGASDVFGQANMTPEGGAKQFDLRKHDSVDKGGNPDGTGQGMGWFPGYAIDVETGERLNIFFAENSAFNDERSLEVTGTTDLGNGDDMIWNPNSTLLAPNTQQYPAYQSYFGGQHFIYVTKTKYDECAEIEKLLSKNSFSNKIKLMPLITYAAFPLTSEPLLSVADGIIPTDAIFKVRVTNQFNKEVVYPDVNKPKTCETVGGTPVYEFAFTNVAATDKAYAEDENPLDGVGVVPNPYYAYSAYETSQFDNSVKVTNLPPKAVVTIYSLDGKFIKQFRRDEQPISNVGSNPVLLQNQIYPALEWDLKNDVGIPVASGVYIFHIEALGAERSIKWFGVNRKFDPTGL